MSYAFLFCPHRRPAAQTALLDDINPVPERYTPWWEHMGCLPGWSKGEHLYASTSPTPESIAMVPCAVLPCLVLACVRVCYKPISTLLSPRQKAPFSNIEWSESRQRQCGPLLWLMLLPTILSKLGPTARSALLDPRVSVAARLYGSRHGTRREFL